VSGVRGRPGLRPPDGLEVVPEAEHGGVGAGELAAAGFGADDRRSTDDVDAAGNANG